jgi:hypothetical protein
MYLLSLPSGISIIYLVDHLILSYRLLCAWNSVLIIFLVLIFTSAMDIVRFNLSFIFYNYMKHPQCFLQDTLVFYDIWATSCSATKYFFFWPLVVFPCCIYANIICKIIVETTLNIYNPKICTFPFLKFLILSKSCWILFF